MHYSHHNTQLRYAARVSDLQRLRNDEGLVSRVVRSFRKR